MNALLVFAEFALALFLINRFINTRDIVGRFMLLSAFLFCLAAGLFLLFALP
jgi:hypothetical protein